MQRHSVDSSHSSFLSKNSNSNLHSVASSALDSPRVVPTTRYDAIETQFLEEVFFALDADHARAEAHQSSDNRSLGDVSKVWTVLMQPKNHGRIMRLCRRCLDYIARPSPSQFAHASDFLNLVVIQDRNLPSSIVKLLRAELERIKDSTPYRTVLKACIELLWNLDKYHP